MTNDMRPPEMAACRKCHISFEPKDHQIRKSDFLCPSCNREYRREYREMRKAMGRPVVTGKMPRSYHQAYEAAYRQKPEVKERLRQKARDRRNNPAERHKHEARWKVNRAIAAGRLTKRACRVCGDIRSQAHHEDYSKPLDVVWLCAKHHAELHAKAKATGQ